MPSPTFTEAPTAQFSVPTPKRAMGLALELVSRSSSPLQIARSALSMPDLIAMKNPVSRYRIASLRMNGEPKLRLFKKFGK